MLGHNFSQRSALLVAACSLAAVVAGAPDVPSVSSSSPRDSAESLTPKTFAALCKLIKPARGESRWAEIPWMLSVYDARKKAAEFGKPIFIWSSGGAPPLGGC